MPGPCAAGGGTAALDVGCGTGNLVRRLALVFPSVTGIEPDAATAAIAAQRFQDSGTIRIAQHRFDEESRQNYDLIVFSASLHHMELMATLIRVRSMLRPGGRVVIVGVARETSADIARSLVSLVLNPIIGFLRHPQPVSEPPVNMQAPAIEATEAFDDIRAIADQVMPGIRMRRRLFWRYTAYWMAPEPHILTASVEP